jgi:hypothetical protein
MLHSFVLGAIRHCIQFLNWQGIHVGPNCDCRARTVSFKKPDDASMRDAGLNRKAKALEMLGHYVRGSKLAVTKLGILVQVTANLDKFRLKGCGKMLNFAIGHFEINLVECMLSASGEEISPIVMAALGPFTPTATTPRVLL